MKPQPTTATADSNALPVLLIDWAAKAGQPPAAVNHCQRWGLGERTFCVHRDGAWIAREIMPLMPFRRRSGAAGSGASPSQAVLDAARRPACAAA